MTSNAANKKSRASTPILIGVLMLLVLAVLVTGVLTELNGREAYTSAQKANDLLLEERTAYGLFVDTQAAMRGFILTNNEVFLGPFYEAKETLPGLWDEMDRLAQEIDREGGTDGTSSSLQSALADMRLHVGRYIEYAEENVALMRSGQEREAAEAIISGRGLVISSQGKIATSRLIELTAAQQEAGTSSLNRARQLELGLLIGLSVLAALTAILAISVSRREARQQEEARGEADAERDRLLTIIENLPVAVRLIDAKTGKVVLQNASASTNITQDEWNRVPLEEQGARFGLTRPDGQVITPAESPLIRAIREGVAVTDYEMRMTSPRLGERDLQVSAAPLRDRHGNVALAVLLVKDVTALRTADRRKDEFIATAAHEIRNPLAALSGYQQLLRRIVQRADAPPSVIQNLDAMGKQINRVNTLVERLLDAQRIELGRLVLDKAPTPLRPVVENAIEAARLADDQGHTIDVHLPEEEIAGQWDPTRLEQVLSNLVGNAIRYSPPGSPIQVRGQRQNGTVRIDVIDQGPGVPPAQRARLFDRWYQSELDTTGTLNPDGVGLNRKSRLGKRRGLGLGLYISREIVRAHGGEIDVEPNPAGGSIFSLTLPAGDTSPSHGNSAAPRADKA